MPGALSYLPERYLTLIRQSDIFAAMDDEDPPKPLKMSDLTGFTELNEFGTTPREEHLVQTLENPKLPGAMKLGAVNAITKARMRHQFANLLSSEMENLRAALADLRAENPKVYIDQLLSAAEFALPRMKAVEIEKESESARQAKEMSMDDLMRIALGPEPDADVVSIQ